MGWAQNIESLLAVLEYGGRHVSYRVGFTCPPPYVVADATRLALRNPDFAVHSPDKSDLVRFTKVQKKLA